jgi:hypothetical protein
LAEAQLAVEAGVSDNEIELEVGEGVRPGEYSVRVVRAAGGGEPRGTLRLDIGELIDRRARLEDSVLASAARARRAAGADEPLRQIGEQLFGALFAGPVAGAYRASLAVVKARSERLRVVLRLTAAELSLLPWEAMWDPELEAYLCRREPLVRHIPAPYTPEPLPVSLPLRVLGLIASPRGLPALDIDTERRHLEGALEGSMRVGRVVLEWETQASWESVQDRLLSGPWHVLHFIGHGDYDPAGDEGTVALVGEGGRPDWVQAGRLADLIGEAQPPPRLVVLNSCSSATGGASDLFSGTAAMLVRSGISAVAAMQFSVSDRAAVAFPRGFYAALAAGRDVDDAAQSGRLAILGVPHSLEWVTPVLYVRGAATRLFTLTDMSGQIGAPHSTIERGPVSTGGDERPAPAPTLISPAARTGQVETVSPSASPSESAGISSLSVTEPRQRRSRRRSTALIAALIGLVVVIAAVATLVALASSGSKKRAPAAANTTTPTTTPLGQLVFSDSFADPASGWAPDAGQDGTGSASYVPGGYQVTVLKPLPPLNTFSVASPHAAKLPDIAIEVDITLVTAAAADGAGVRCDVNARSAVRYTFEVYADGSWVVFRLGGPGQAVVAQGTSPAIKTGNATNTVTGQCSQLPNGMTRLTMTVNGVRLNSAVNAPGAGVTGWHAALVVSRNQASPGTVGRFSNFRIYDTSAP